MRARSEAASTAKAPRPAKAAGRALSFGSLANREALSLGLGANLLGGQDQVVADAARHRFRKAQAATLAAVRQQPPDARGLNDAPAEREALPTSEDEGFRGGAGRCGRHTTYYCHRLKLVKNSSMSASIFLPTAQPDSSFHVARCHAGGLSRWDALRAGHARRVERVEANPLHNEP